MSDPNSPEMMIPKPVHVWWWVGGANVEIINSLQARDNDGLGRWLEHFNNDNCWRCAEERAMR